MKRFKTRNGIIDHNLMYSQMQMHNCCKIKISVVLLSWMLPKYTRPTGENRNYILSFPHKTSDTFVNLRIETSLHYENISSFYYFVNVKGILEHMINETASQLMH